MPQDAPEYTATRLIGIDEADAIEIAAGTLMKGALAALPTETVYGLCALAARDDAVAKVFAAKGRPARNPLIVHGADRAMLEALAEFGPDASALADAFWPGPLTLVARKRPGAALAAAATAGGPTVALRVPAPAFVRAVAERTGPLVAPSANRSGKVSATSAKAVLEELGGRIALVVDGGPSAIGVESTVIDTTGAPRLLRPGAIGRDAIEAVVGPLAAAADAPAAGDGEPLRSPGLLGSHYAPSARLRLDVEAADVRPGEGWLALGDAPSAAGEDHTVRLSATGDVDEAARALYAGLRALDAAGVAVIAVSPVPDRGIGAAIRDRLKRAAAPRTEDPE